MLPNRDVVGSLLEICWDGDGTLSCFIKIIIFTEKLTLRTLKRHFSVNRRTKGVELHWQRPIKGSEAYR